MTPFGIEPDTLTIAMVTIDYLKFAKANYCTGKTSEVHRIKYALRPVKDLYASLGAAEFAPSHFKAVRQRLLDGGSGRNVINAEMKRIIRMLRRPAVCI